MLIDVLIWLHNETLSNINDNNSFIQRNLINYDATYIILLPRLPNYQTWGLYSCNANEYELKEVFISYVEVESDYFWCNI
jgi:hypothetical protein